MMMGLVMMVVTAMMMTRAGMVKVRTVIMRRWQGPAFVGHL